MFDDYISYKEALFLFEQRGLSEFDLIATFGESTRSFYLHEVMRQLENSDIEEEEE